MALANGPKLGYDDLNQLMEKPTDLLFRIGKLAWLNTRKVAKFDLHFTELLGVDLPQSYQKETWQMDERERLDALPRLKHEGNNLYQNKKNAEASLIYAQAIGIIEQLQLKYFQSSIIGGSQWFEKFFFFVCLFYIEKSQVKKNGEPWQTWRYLFYSTTLSANCC